MFASRLLVYSSIVFLLHSCSSPKQEEDASVASATADPVYQPVEVEYATQFDITYGDGYKVVEVLQPYPGAEKAFRYLLIPEGEEKPAGIEADAVVQIPVQELVSTSTTHIPSLVMLGAADVLTGFPSTDFISSPEMRARIDSGKVRDLGATNGLNIEALLELSPDMVMAYGMGPQDKSLQSLERTGIPVVLNADFMEQNPLGRAEWIKFTAAFLNKEKEADSVFNFIKNRYDSLATLTANVQKEPEVFSGVVYNGTWFMPGGQSWSARFFEDAGGNYLWSKNSETGSLQLSFESVFEKAHQADYWIGTANYPSLQALKEADERYSQFEAWQEEDVYTYTAREGATGGNEYLELGYSRPDMVLADLIYILHPELLPEYSPYFYKKLE